ncbi:MAG: hypothetical protein QOI01_4319 [Mycobacterium sp.]|jgi:hypothetical protein|nr:hypothetical protein [Mycobacterium sp.]
MTSHEQDDREHSSQANSGSKQGFDPRDTEHPAGSKQAAENTDEESPS